MSNINRAGISKISQDEAESHELYIKQLITMMESYPFESLQAYKQGSYIMVETP